MPVCTFDMCSPPSPCRRPLRPLPQLLPESRHKAQGKRMPVLCRYFRTAAKYFWLAAPRATGALEVIRVVPKGEPRRPPLKPLHLHGQHAHACWASSLTATCCLPQVGQSKRRTLVFKCIRSVQVPARARACKGSQIRGPVRAPRSVVSIECRA